MPPIGQVSPPKTSRGADPDVLKAALGLSSLSSPSNHYLLNQLPLNHNYNLVTPTDGSRTKSMLPSTGVIISKSLVSNCVKRCAHLMNAYMLQYCQHRKKMPNGKYNEILTFVKKQYHIPLDYNIPRHTICGVPLSVVICLFRI